MLQSCLDARFSRKIAENAVRNIYFAIFFLWTVSAVLNKISSLFCTHDYFPKNVTSKIQRNKSLNPFLNCGRKERWTITWMTCCTLWKSMGNRRVNDSKIRVEAIHMSEKHRTSRNWQAWLKRSIAFLFIRHFIASGCKTVFISLSCLYNS